MKASQVKPDVDPTAFPQKPCYICKKSCTPYGFTTWGDHLCSRVCSEAWDKKKYAPTDRQ